MTTTSLIRYPASFKTPTGKMIVLAIKAAKVAYAKQLNHLKIFEVSFIPWELTAPRNLDKKVASEVTKIA